MRAPFFTTFMQVFSRYAIVWGVTGPFPGVARGGPFPAYASMLLAWAATEVVRYSYFALALASSAGRPPAALHWLRYHAFFVLYPVGISSEAWLIWRAVAPARDAVHPYYSTALFLYVVAVYPPGKSFSLSLLVFCLTPPPPCGFRAFSLLPPSGAGFRNKH